MLAIVPSETETAENPSTGILLTVTLKCKKSDRGWKYNAKGMEDRRV